MIENNLKRKPDIKQKDISREVVATVSEEQIKLEIKKNKITRYLYMAGGTASLILAIVGIVVPGLPTTPFALLAAFLFAKSSERLYNWLLNNRILGPRIKSYHKNKGVTKKGKIGIIIFMTLMVLLSSFVVIKIIKLRILILTLGLIGSITVWFFVPTAKDD